MTEIINKKVNRACSHLNVAQEYYYYCKLFDDMVIRTSCLLRRKELIGRKDYACGGCSKDTIMNSRHNLLSARQAES
jgi:hypothetical protein